MVTPIFYMGVKIGKPQREVFKESKGLLKNDDVQKQLKIHVLKGRKAVYKEK